MPPDSTNPSPTQEVERLELDTVDRGARMLPEPAGDFVRYEDHQHLLQAEVEKREEAVKERESLVGELAKLLGPQKPRPGVSQNDQFIAAVTQLLIDKEAAESRLSAVEEEAAKQKKAAEDIEGDAKSDRSRDFWAGIVAGTDALLQILRDKGTEQGGDNV